MYQENYTFQGPSSISAHSWPPLSVYWWAETKEERMTDQTISKGRVHKQAKRASQFLGSCRHQNGKAQRKGHDTAA
jgi:hypothetical protein